MAHVELSFSSSEPRRVDSLAGFSVPNSIPFLERDAAAQEITNLLLVPVLSGARVR